MLHLDANRKRELLCRISQAMSSRGLGLDRALAASGDTAKAHAMYKVLGLLRSERCSGEHQQG